jgi:serine/threonine-protein kinase
MDLPPLDPPPGFDPEPVVEKDDEKEPEREAGKEEPRSTTAQVTAPPADPPSTPRQPGVKPTARPAGGTGLRVTTADRLSPETAAAKDRQGMRLLSRGQLAKAKEQFWECLAHDPKAARCFRGLGEVSAALGSTEEALEYYARFLELDPRGEGAEAARSYIRKTRRARSR